MYSCRETSLLPAPKPHCAPPPPVANRFAYKPAQPIAATGAVALLDPAASAMVSPPRNEPPSPPQPPPHLQRFVSSTTKQLSRSQSSSSFEADDEQSFTDRDSMEPDRDRQLRGPPQYAGEDTRWVSKKELAGWYAYGFAAEVFIICGVGG